MFSAYSPVNWATQLATYLLHTHFYELVKQIITDDKKIISQIIKMNYFWSKQVITVRIIQVTAASEIIRISFSQLTFVSWRCGIKIAESRFNTVHIVSFPQMIKYTLDEQKKMIGLLFKTNPLNVSICFELDIFIVELMERKIS